MTSPEQAGPRKYPLEAFEYTIEGDPSESHEIIQFADNTTALLWRVRGHTLDWDMQKHAMPDRINNCTILTMEDGARIAVGVGVIARLPELDKETGKYDASEPLKATEVHQLAPNGLAPVRIGETWPFFEARGPVKSAMVRYKLFASGQAKSQVEMPSHLESAVRLMHVASARLSDFPIPPA